MEIVDLKRLAGVTGTATADHTAAPLVNGTEKARYMREHNIRPGTEEWFRLWFARTAITGEKPY